MGICFSKEYTKIRSLQDSAFKSNYKKIRSVIIDFIHIFHKIGRSCGLGLETALLKNCRDLGIIIKKKQIYVEKNLENLRSTVKKIDDFFEKNPEIEDNIKVLDESQKIIKGINKELAVDDIFLLISPEVTSEYLNKINKLLDEQKINYENFQILQEIDEKLKKNNERKRKSTSVRKRYSRHKISYS